MILVCYPCFLFLWTFEQSNSLALKIFIPQAFEANASFSGGILTSSNVNVNKAIPGNVALWQLQ